MTTDEIIDRILNNLKKVDKLISLLNDFTEEIRRLEEINIRNTIHNSFFGGIMPEIRNENIELVSWRIYINNIECIHIPRSIWDLLYNIIHIDEIKEEVSKLPPSPEKEFLEFLISLHPQP